MAEKIQNRSYSPYDASLTGGFFGGGVTGITAAFLGTRGLIRAARIESHAGRLSLQSVFHRDIGRSISKIVFDSLTGRDFLRFLPKLRSLIVLGGVAGGTIGLGSEAVFSFRPFYRDEISGEEYAKRILWSGGLGFLGGSVAGLGSVGSVRLFHWLNPHMGVADGFFWYSVASILAGFGVGGYAGLALSKAKESFFS